MSEIPEFCSLASLFCPSQPARRRNSLWQMLYLHANLLKTSLHAVITAQMTPWSHPPVPLPLFDVLSPLYHVDVVSTTPCCSAIAVSSV